LIRIIGRPRAAGLFDPPVRVPGEPAIEKRRSQRRAPSDLEMLGQVVRNEKTTCTRENDHRKHADLMHGGGGIDPLQGVIEIGVPLDQP
jgi:hypothetical protein